MIAQQIVKTREKAVMLGNLLVQEGIVTHIYKGDKFEDENSLYQFTVGFQQQK